MTEPGAGSDALGSMSTTANRVETNISLMEENYLSLASS